MARLLASLGALALALVVSVTAHAFEGRYQIKGSGPNPADQYEGIAQIKKTGDTYTVMWQVKDMFFVGTGILTDGVLSVVFLPINARAGPGIASFRVVNGGVVGGQWTSIGLKVVAQEQWTPFAGDDAPKAPTGDTR